MVQRKAGSGTFVHDTRAVRPIVADLSNVLSHLIDMGRALPPLPEADRTDAAKVRGCASQVWLVSEATPDGRLIFRGDSDAHIVRGLVALILQLYSGRAPREILAFDAKAALASLGLEGALSTQRSNGLASMVARIRRDAELAQAA